MQIKCQANNRFCNHDIDFIDFTHIRENHSFNNTCILKCVKMNTFPIYINLKIDNNSFSIKNTQGFIKLDSLKYISSGSFQLYLALTIFQIQCQIYPYISWHNQLHWVQSGRKKKDQDSANFSFAGNQSIVNWNSIDFPEWYGLTGCYTPQ